MSFHMAFSSAIEFGMSHLRTHDNHKQLHFRKRQQILRSLLPTWQKVRFCTLWQDAAFWHYQTTLLPDLSIGLEGQGTGQMAAVLTLLGNSQQMAALSTGSSICPSSLNVLCSIKSYISEKIIQKRSIIPINISYYE